MPLDLRLLVAFIAVAETGNVGQAARRLHISQSPLSRQILQLESQLGLRLFERARQRMHLTDEGRVFHLQARNLIAHASEVQAAARRMGIGEIGHITVGYVEAAMHSNALPRALAGLQAGDQGATFELRPMGSSAQVEALLDRALDFGLVYSAPKNADIESVEVLNEAVLLALGKAHAMAKQANITPEDLNGERWVALAMSKNTAARHSFLENCSGYGFLPDIKVEADDLLAVLRLVASGLGITFVQSSLRDFLSDGIVFRELPWLQSRVRVYAIWRKGDPKPLVARLRQVLSEG